jgi:glycosyltransferase involved in cell wall biosynthesis
VRVLHFLWSGEVGGAERALYQLVARQALEPDMEVGVLFGRPTGPWFERFSSLPVSVSSVSARSGRDLRIMRAGTTAMREWDLHHFHSIEPLAFAASLAAGRPARVFTNRAGTPEPAGPRKALRYRAAAVMLRRGFHGFSGNTRHAARAGAQRFGIDPSRFVTTYNGIDFSLLDPGRTRAEVRREAGLGAGFVVGTAAILKPWKRVDRLLRAAAAADVPGLEVLVLGDGPELGRLRALAGRLGIAERVRFAGRVPDATGWIAALDAFVLPSNDRESFGNAVVEAMALGVPSAVFVDSPGIREHVQDERTGFVVRDPEALARVLERLASDPGLRSAIGAAGSAAVRSRYTLDAMASSYADLYARAQRARGAR